LFPKLPQMRRIVLCVIAAALSGTSQAQLNVDPTLERGLKPYGSYEGGAIDSISTVNGSLNLNIPLVSYPQRGGKLHLAFYVDYHTNSYVHTPSTIKECTTYPYDCAYGDEYNQGSLQISPDFDFQLWAAASMPPPGGGSWATIVTPDGAQHEMGPTTTGTRTVDATGYLCLSNCTTIVDRDGIQYSGFGGTELFASKIQDPNGNYITPVHQSNGTTISYTDSMGRSVAVPFFVTAGSGPTTDYTGCTGSTSTSSAYNWVLPGYQGQMTYKICNGTSTVVNYQCIEQAHRTTCTHVSSTVHPIQSIVLPNNTAWTFAYDNIGDLVQITFPTGGYIKYTWSFVYYCQTPTPTTSTTYSAVVTSRTVNANDGTGEHTWTYSFPQNLASGHTTSSIDPLNQKTVHTVTAIASSCSFYETQTQKYDSAGNLLKTVTTDYTGTADPMGIPPVKTAGNVVAIRRTTTWPNGSVSKVETDYDPGVPMTGIQSGYTLLYGIPVSKRDYDYGSGAPGSLLSQTTTHYTALSGPNASSYLANNVLTLPYTVQVSDPSGQLSLTQYNYDETSRASSGLTSGYQFNSSPPDGAYRGNNTSLLQLLNSGTFTCPNGNSGGSNGYLIAKTTYFDDGMLNTSADPCGNTTTYAYSLTYWGALPTTVTNALSQQTTNVYDFNASLKTSATDPNQLITYHTYDSLWRLYQTTHPDSSVDIDTTTRQESAFPFTATLTSAMNTAQNSVPLTVFDGLGRVSQTQHTSDPQGSIYTDTTYDALGRVGSVSNPYRTGTDATSSSGATSYAYDALNRKTQENLPDGSIIKTAYCGPWTLVTDPTGRWRRSRVDAIGRLVEVDEPNSSTATVNSNACPGTNDPVWVTVYTYDGLGRLGQVIQNGSHGRNFSYDSVSRLLTSNNPETGTIIYTYNPDGTLFTKKDARGITTCHGDWSSSSSTCNGSTGYDGLHRELKITYSNADPTLSFTYDQSVCLGLTACHNIGHRTSMTDGAGSEHWAYEVDKTNNRNIHRDQRTNSSITKTTTYYLDFQGNVTQIVYPTGRTVNYAYDSANRPSSASDASNGITYVAGWKTPPAGTNCTAGSVCYTPQGSVYGMSVGQSSSYTGLDLLETFNNRLQPNKMEAGNGSTAFNVTYNFVDPVSGKNSGHVYGITDNANSGLSQTFTYDQLNRITSAGTAATSGLTCWGYQYSYDAWGNLLSQAGWSPTYNNCTEYVMGGVTADGNNHVSGFSYDASGNTQNDGVFSYTWDAESQMKTAGSVTYTYDGDGRRAAKVGSKLYWYGVDGEILAETDASGKTLQDYVYFGKERVALVPASGTTLLYAEDFLGSSRLIVQSDGTLCYYGEFTPYGAEVPIYNACPQNYKFEGKERDTETANDNFGAREYSLRFGRWLSSDWSATPVPVPYANLSNPQTLNLYAMVEDDPESFADLDGHCPPCGEEILEEIVIDHPKVLGAIVEAETEAETEVGEILASAPKGPGSWGLGAVGRISLGTFGFYLGEMINPHQSVGGDKTQEQLKHEQEQQQEPEPQTSTSGAGARQGGGRNAQKSNQDRTQSAQDKVKGLRQERDALKSKANKTPEDKAKLDKLNKAIKRETDRMKKSETHSRKEKGQQ
jgi:RHS repeat-associated protein